MKHGGTGKPDQTANLRFDISHADAVRMLNVSTRSVADGAKVVAKGSKKLIGAVEAGEIAVSVAAKIADHDKAPQSNEGFFGTIKSRVGDWFAPTTPCSLT